MTSEAPIKALMLVELPELMLDSPKYTEAQNQLAKAEGAIKTETRWWELPSGKLLVPEEAGLTRKFETSHVGGATGRTPPIPRSGPPLRRTRGPDPSSKATLWVKAQHEGALPPPCIVRKDPRGPHTARRGA